MEPEKYVEGLGRAAVKSHWIYINEIIGLEFFDPWLHGEEIFGFIDRNLGRCMMILAPREAGKSSGVTVPLPARILAESSLSSVLICNAREDKAAKMARACSAIITRNKKYQACFPEIAASKKWGEGGYYLKLSEDEDGEESTVDFASERIDPSIGSFGTTSNIVGSHISGAIIHDDLINKEIAKFPTQVRSVEEFVRESMNCLDTGATMLCIGTRWTYFDYYGKIASGEIISKSGEPFEVLKLGVKRPNGDIIWPQTTFVDLSGKERKVGYTENSIAAQKLLQGRYFSALYYNEPVLDEDVQFDIRNIKTFKWLPPFEVGPAIAVGLEVGAQQGAALKYPLLELKRRERKGFRVEELKRTNKNNKQDIIRGTLQTLIAEGRLAIEERIFNPNMAGLGQELRDFDRGSDDCLDALCHAISIAKNPPPGAPPFVYIACDPAFSLDGDATAICAICMLEDEVYVLDLDRFFTDRTDNVIRRIFAMYDKWSSGKRREPRTYGIKTEGIVSSGHKNFGVRSQKNTIYHQDMTWGDEKLQRVKEIDSQIERQGIFYDEESGKDRH